MAFLSRSLCGLILALVLALPARASGGFTDMVRYVFVPVQGASAITVIDSRDDSVAGTVEAGLVPNQLEVSGDLARLAAADGRSPRVAVVELGNGAVHEVALPFSPDRLTTSGNGRYLAAVALEAGEAAFIDLYQAKVTGRVSGLGALTDILLNADATTLYIATRGREGLGVVDIAAGRIAAEIAPGRSGQGEIATLSRAPSGRVVFLKPAKTAAIAVADLRTSNTSAMIETGAGVSKAYTNATGITLVLPDNQQHSVDFLAASTYKRKATLRGAGGMIAVYSGWFDTVSFIPSTAEKAVLVFDQQGLFRGDDIPLGGVPGRGTVTPDGKKLYLPLMDADTLMVVDAENRRLSGQVALPGRPAFAVMGRTFGICH